MADIMKNLSSVFTSIANNNSQKVSSGGNNSNKNKNNQKRQQNKKQQQNKQNKQNKQNQNRRKVRGGGTDEQRWECGKCSMVSSTTENTGGNNEKPETPVSPPPSVPQEQPTEVKPVEGTVSQDGGASKKAKTLKGAYKKFLNKFTLEKLQKEAKKRHIKITTKKNGKTLYIKKASLVNKICNIKYPSK